MENGINPCVHIKWCRDSHNSQPRQRRTQHMQTLTKVLANSARDGTKEKITSVRNRRHFTPFNCGKNNAINCNAYTEPTSCICKMVERCVQTRRKTCISTDIAACIVNMCCLQCVTLYETNNAEQLEKTGRCMWGGWDGAANVGATSGGGVAGKNCI